MVLQSSSRVAEIRAALAATRRTPRALASAMPPSFYLSDEWLALEHETIFRSEWICVGRAEQVAKPGDYFATDIVGESILVVHAEDGRIQAMSNVCRHRSMRLKTGHGNAKFLVCPYHAWTYANDGRLMRAPHMEKVAGFDVKSCALPKFQCETWQGFVYVNLKADAPSLNGRLGGLVPFVRNFHLADMRQYYREDEVWETNWKCLAENFMEGYHLSVTHPKTLHPITPTALCEKIPGGDAYTGYKSHYDPAFPSRKPFSPDLTETEQRYTMMFWVYPSHVVALTPNMVTYMSLQPLGPDRVRVSLGIAAYDLSQPEEQRTKYTALATAFNNEDRQRLEQMQIGLKGRSAGRGRLGPDDLEGTIWDFYHYMAARFLPKKKTGSKVKTRGRIRATAIAKRKER